jgi:hypothetical protein
MTPQVPKVEVEGQHIFPDDELHQYALRWKELNAQKKHTEAMVLLEKIIEGSTPMFERFAQSEKFHHTVDLEILVSAAQEKVVKWLLRWEPKLGKLFTWFSKSFHASTYVVLSDGSAKQIKEIVDGKLRLKVLTWNRATGQFEPKPIINWIKSPAQPDRWSKLVVKMPPGGQPGNKNRDGAKKRFLLTTDHEVYTGRGIVRVGDLRESDTLYAGVPEITPDGMAVLIGKYLGDGSITKKGHVMVGHSGKQDFYVRHLASKFGNRPVHRGTVTLEGKKHSVSRCRILAKRIWPDFPLEAKKVISEWLLDNLNPIAIAYWYMDDGTLARAHNGRQFPLFCSESFSQEDCLRICERLLVEWGLHTWLKKEKWGYGYRIALKDESLERFFGYVAPYLLPQFAYKIPLQFQDIPKIDIDCVRYMARPCRSFTVHRAKAVNAAFDYKYDITVADNHNVVISQNGKTQQGALSGLCVLQCAKHAFLSELVKVNQYRKRYHATSDSLEKFIGTEDHAIDKHDLAAEVRQKLSELTCRWGDPQEIGALGFLIECIIDEENRDRQAAIRGAAYAFGITMDMSKFFYRWALTALRSAFMDKIRVDFSEQDLFLLSESYTDFVELYNDVPWENLKVIMLKHGGKRIKIPTLTYVIGQKENYQMWREIEATSKDPSSIAEIAERHKKTAKTAQQTYDEMCEKLNPHRAGEYFVFHPNEDEP